MKIKLLVYLFSVSFASVQFSCSDSGSKSQNIEKENNGDKKPNIILIMNDDMGYECLSCNGSVSYNTPELDSLAENGIRFTNCYSQPLCTPSRVKIMTGKYNSNNYIDFGYLDPSQKTFGNILQEAGYKTMIAGKWQLNGVHTQEDGYMDLNRPNQFGFDEYCLWWLTSKSSRYAKPGIVQNGKLLETTIDDYGPDIMSDYIVDFVERNRNESFFVYYPMLLVHAPFQPTPDSPEWDLPEQRSENDTKYFKDMVEYTDKIIGKIAYKLEELGIAENTMLIFTGDNGTATSIVTQTTDGPYKGGKGWLFDNGTHVPLVIGWPAGGNQNTTTSVLIEFSDFLPTFADAANTPIPADIDGTSFYDFLTKQPYNPRESVFVHYHAGYSRGKSPRNGCFIRTASYKLYSDGRFYDMLKDKWEKNPLDVNELESKDRDAYLQLSTELKNKPVWDFSDNQPGL
jgi:arylsulfatase A